jgi:NTP pyrophosphatase (non-canonical NTP hydrolase)
MSYSAAHVTSWFDDMQENVGRWAIHNFPEASKLNSVASVSEEAGELLRAIRKQEQGIRGTYAEWEAELRKEHGDVLIALFQSAYACDIDLLEVFQERWAEVRQRDFRKDPKGHGLPEE